MEDQIKLIKNEVCVAMFTKVQTLRVIAYMSFTIYLVIKCIEEILSRFDLFSLQSHFLYY